MRRKNSSSSSSSGEEKEEEPKKATPPVDNGIRNSQENIEAIEEYQDEGFEQEDDGDI
jgi:hypothetical protein